MIIRLESSTAGQLEAAKQDLEMMAHRWGYQLHADPATPNPLTAVRTDAKGIDPVSVVALALSIPSVALAVLDLADRIHKRRRAHELIDQSRQLAAQHITIYLITPGHQLELPTLDPDQLLDLIADQEQNH